MDLKDVMRTTFIVRGEERARALFGLADYYAVAGLLPTGKPLKQLTNLTRKPVEVIATVYHFEGPALES